MALFLDEEEEEAGDDVESGELIIESCSPFKSFSSSLSEADAAFLLLELSPPFNLLALVDFFRPGIEPFEFERRIESLLYSPPFPFMVSDCSFSMLVKLVRLFVRFDGFFPLGDDTDDELLLADFMATVDDSFD